MLYEKAPVQMPLALAEGDIVRIHSAGLYTACYSTVGFKGFEPLRTRVHATFDTDSLGTRNGSAADNCRVATGELCAEA